MSRGIKIEFKVSENVIAVNMLRTEPKNDCEYFTLLMALILLNPLLQGLSI